MKLFRYGLENLWAGLPPAPAPLATLRYDLALLTRRRGWLYLFIDLLLLQFSLVAAADIGDPAEIDHTIYLLTTVLPLVLIGLPMLSGSVALEREAGAMDLALSVRSTQRYFVRRAASVVALGAFQGGLILATMTHLPWAVRAAALGYATALSLLIGSLSLFWSVRFRTAGAVLVACWLSLAPLLPWLRYDPLEVLSSAEPPLFGLSPGVWEWCWRTCFLAGCSVLLYLYSRLRLRSAERLL